ncbi:MAG: alpha-L-fucosidase [Verrucomicrobiales bacterium]
MISLPSFALRGIAFAALAFGSFSPLFAAESPDPYANETKEQRDERMKWWRDAKFGMFIHWGVYAVPAGTYEGKQIKGIGEWIMLNGKIPSATYKKYAEKFTASKYDPAAWAALAKRAGMRYMVITSKHHDGFALFDSKVSYWDAVDASAAKRDLIKPLAEAARKEGLRFGLYYSQAQDWNHPGGAKARMKEGESWDPATKGSYDTYLQTIAEPQVKEILTQIKPDILWWDTPHWMTKERAEPLIRHLSLVPGIIHNNRLGGEFKGDTETPEQHIPATGFKDRDWEVCMTMNDTWGFKSYDHNWKSTNTILHQLCDIVSKGGNFLLNVGPTAEGEIPKESIKRLEAVGRWIDVNGEAIYGTTASPFHRLPWGRCTRKATATGTTLYFHVFDWPVDGKLFIPGLKNKVKSAALLAGSVAVPVTAGGEGVTLQLPAQAPDADVSVIRVETEGALDVDPIALSQQENGSVRLDLEYTEINNPGYGTHAKLVRKNGNITLDSWSDARAWMQWTFRVNRPGEFKVVAQAAAKADSALTLGIGPNDKACKIKSTGGDQTFAEVVLGKITVSEAGVHELRLRPAKDGWKPVSLRGLTLEPARK